MNNGETDFVRFLVDEDVIQFGEYVLKSGRSSPYFFNLGAIDTARGLAALGRAYAKKIRESKLEFDILFGPAYKGIPIAVTTAIALCEDYGINPGVAFNRKEAKKHGEGGNLIGHALNGRVLILDDVITAGTAITESSRLVEQSDATLTGIVVAMDRQELLENRKTALDTMALTHNVPVHSLSKLEHVIAYLEESSEDSDTLGKLRAHRASFC
ncbi:MAG: orotate phosphoribosyltransferase [Pseudomonadales bacterium]|nr:orotate phosphoribosyltransferase [Pseudomonadales bacterium]